MPVYTWLELSCMPLRTVNQKTKTKNKNKESASMPIDKIEIFLINQVLRSCMKTQYKK